MNGRVYDYNLGRFMSVDPVIQSPGNSQSINPYSYIMNNPLAGVDPTGYVAEDPELKKIEYTKTTEKVAVTGSRIKREVTTGVSGTATYSNGATQSFSATFSNGKVASMDIGSMQQIGKRNDVVARSATAGTTPQGGTATIPNIGDLADGIGKELLGAAKKGLILYALKPGELGDATLSGAIARGEIDESQLILYHYTNSEENLASIVQTQTLRASFGEKNARYGPGQYFTDLHPGMIAAETMAGLSKDDITIGSMSKGQAARLLFGDSRKKASLNYYLKIDVGGLQIQNPRPNVYYLPNDKPLDLSGRIKGYGATLDSN